MRSRKRRLHDLERRLVPGNLPWPDPALGLRALELAAADEGTSVEELNTARPDCLWPDMANESWTQYLARVADAEDVPLAELLEEVEALLEPARREPIIPVSFSAALRGDDTSADN